MSRLKVVSNGNPLDITVLIDGKKLEGVVGVSWGIGPDDLVDEVALIIRPDSVELELEGKYEVVYHVESWNEDLLPTGIDKIDCSLSPGDEVIVYAKK